MRREGRPTWDIFNIKGYVNLGMCFLNWDHTRSLSTQIFWNCNFSVNWRNISKCNNRSCFYFLSWGKPGKNTLPVHNWVRVIWAKERSDWNRRMPEQKNLDLFLYNCCYSLWSFKVIIILLQSHHICWEHLFTRNNDMECSVF